MSKTNEWSPSSEHGELMRSIVNHTPLRARLGISRHPDGIEILTAVAKATLCIPEGGGACSFAPEPLEPLLQPSYVGEPGRSSILHPADLVPYKPGTDVVLVGHAHAPHGRPVPRLTTVLEVGDLRKAVLVIGDRQWRSSSRGLVMTEPEPFERMPMLYERAFGGCPPSQRHALEPDRDERNPIGTGYCVLEADTDGMRLPNLEAPQARIDAWHRIPPIAGFGAIDAHWAARQRFAAPLGAASTDFDPRFHCVASHGLWSPEPLAGELHVELVHLSTEPVLRFRLPDVRVRLAFHLGGRVYKQAAELWTIVLEPDDRRVTMVWGTRCRYHEPRTPRDRIDVYIDSLPTELTYRQAERGQSP